MIDTVTVGGAVLDPGMVLAEVTVLHGRQSFGQGAAASSATLSVELPAGTMPTQGVGETILLDGPTGRMFAGRVVEVSLEHFGDSTGATWGRFTATAAGPVAALGVRKIGDVPWPQEHHWERAEHILAAAGVPYRVEQNPAAESYRVLARDVDAQPAAALLDELSSWTQAAVFDTPSGDVVYQSLESRTRVRPFTWNDFDPALTWDGADPDWTWDAIGGWNSPTSEFPLALPSGVLEWEPRWELSAADVINRVRVSYGTDEPQGVVELVDPASVALHGERYADLGTELVSPPEATQVASRIIATRARERWQLSEVTLALDLLDPASYRAALGLICGDAVTLTGLPQPAPASAWDAIVEGWTFTQYGSGGQLVERLTLALSDQLLSLVVSTWNDFDFDMTWNDFDPATTWGHLDEVG